MGCDGRTSDAGNNAYKGLDITRCDWYVSFQAGVRVAALRPASLADTIYPTTLFRFTRDILA